MHLYQHSARCPTVMQMFLNCYPHYWIFVPMSSRTSSLQQLQQNTNYHQFATIAMTAATRSTVAPRSDHEIRQCLQDVPLSPRGFQFSEQQRDAQTEFFKYKKDLQLPNLPLDLYDASIIAVLPEKSSPVLRQFIVSLFITHGETKLNSIGNLLADNNTNPPFLYGSFRGEWCHSLTNRPTLLSLSSSLTTTTTTTTIIRTTAEPRACSATER
ncbi:unnamed protein product [Rotaria sp. Silwood2]|nr:unnamed protein product [Rotaria sp. Silwood2]CAF4223292.1 unnamed protein product [Rotaria sp. Silwood2]